MGGGRGHRSRTQRKHFRDGRENVWKRPKSDNSSSAVDNPPWQPFATQNPAFDEYYKEQGIVAIEEWDSFVQFLRTPLPSAFRINSSSQFSEDIKLQLENDFMKSLQAEDADGSEVEAIRPLPWYPDNLAWQSNFSRMQLRKNQTLEKYLPSYWMYVQTILYLIFLLRSVCCSRVENIPIARDYISVYGIWITP